MLAHPSTGLVGGAPCPQPSIWHSMQSIWPLKPSMRKLGPPPGGRVAHIFRRLRNWLMPSNCGGVAAGLQTEELGGVEAAANINPAPIKPCRYKSSKVECQTPVLHGTLTASRYIAT